MQKETPLSTWLDKDASYSVLPISKGHKYGSAKGTIQATLADYEDAFFEFEQFYGVIL